MKNLKAKLRRNGGFTLIEMLIVVAIIAILIMVSIPLVSSALDRAKEATDQANERSAFGVAEVKYLASLGANAKDADGNPNSNYITWDANDSATFAYKVDGSQGSLQANGADLAGTAGYNYGQCTKHAGQYLIVQLKKDGSVNIQWSAGDPTSHNGYAKVDSTTP